MQRILFATSEEHPSLTPDDLLAAAALERLGGRVEPLVWSRPGSAPQAADAVVIRSCWDYHLRAADFAGWIDHLEHTGARTFNPAPLLRWNLHKRYLLDLERRGVPIVPTVLVERGGGGSLAALLRERGWEQAVVKPAVSLSAHETWRTSPGEAPAHEARFAAMRSLGDVLVQLFLPEITTAGEWSLVFLGGDYSHAVRKLPRPGDFRVQRDHGGSARAEVPGAGVVRAARRAVDALPLPPLYARVDAVEAGGRLLLMEMECIDPVLFFGVHPPSADRFARLLLEGSSVVGHRSSVVRPLPPHGQWMGGTDNR